MHDRFDAVDSKRKKKKTRQNPQNYIYKSIKIIFHFNNINDICIYNYYTCNGQL